jgi:hypothetical protein
VTTPTHAITLNGWMASELDDDFGPMLDVIRRSLDMLDGVKYYALMLWRIPPGVPWVDVDRSRYPEEYLQCAGSAARQTVEIRRATAAGFEHLVIGKRDLPSLSSSIERIPWDRYEVEVRGNEVFNASEAFEVFRRYFEGDSIDDAFTLLAGRTPDFPDAPLRLSAISHMARFTLS